MLPLQKRTSAFRRILHSFLTSLVGKENRTVIDTSRLPAHVVNAFLAAEDLRFYKHPGFDITRIIGAMLTK